jgi:hypothetical protein
MRGFVQTERFFDYYMINLLEASKFSSLAPSARPTRFLRENNNKKYIILVTSIQVIYPDLQCTILDTQQIKNNVR